VWSTSGNTLTGAGTIGSVSNHDLNFITNNVTRLTIKNNGDVLPGANATYSLGSATMQWDDIYAVTGSFSSDITTSGSITVSNDVIANGVQSTGELSVSGLSQFGGNVEPALDIASDLGSVTNRWQNFYVKDAVVSNDLTVDGTLTANGVTLVGAGNLNVTGELTNSNMQIGSLGTFINQIITDVVAVDPLNITAGTSATFTVTISNVEVGDIIVLTPPSNIEDDLIFQGATVTAANTVTIKIRNLSGSDVNGASRDWSYIITRKTP
jgi:hypothetical protein